MKTTMTKSQTTQSKNGRSSNRCFSKEDIQRGQKVHEKVLNIVNYQKNANQNYYEADLGKRLVLNARRQPEELECGVAITVGVCRSMGLP